jgi:tryptophan-rich sensory protein
MRASVLASVLLLAAGHLVGGLSMRVWGPPGGADQVLLPPWVFGLVWVGLYPCLAVASVAVWAERPRAEVGPALASGVCALAVLLAFMPIACAAQELWVTVLLDALGWVTTWAAGWAYARVSRTALGWMGPLMAWMPVTFAIKLVAAL